MSVPMVTAAVLSLAAFVAAMFTTPQPAEWLLLGAVVALAFGIAADTRKLVERIER